MLKSVAEDANGNVILILGIMGENVKRLQQGQPIMISASEMNEVMQKGGNEKLLSHDVLLFYGETHRDLVRILRRDLGANLDGVRAHIGKLHDGSED
jgi:hypothetical protein